MTAEQLIKSAAVFLQTQAHKDLKDASATELHMAVSAAAMEALAPVWRKRRNSGSPVVRHFTFPWNI